MVTIGHIPQMITQLSYRKLEIDSITLPPLENIYCLRTKTNKQHQKHSDTDTPTHPQSNSVSQYLHTCSCWQRITHVMSIHIKQKFGTNKITSFSPSYIKNSHIQPQHCLLFPNFMNFSIHQLLPNKNIAYVTVIHIKQKMS